ncbi:oxygen-dependent choline dehydrogenase [Tanacetum coccineum]
MRDTTTYSPSKYYFTEGIIKTRATIHGGGTCINAGFYSRGEAQFNKEARLMDENLVQESYKWTERVMVFEPVVQEWPSAVQAALLKAGVTPDNGFTYDHIIRTKVSGTVFDENGTRHTVADLLQYANPKGLSVLHKTRPLALWSSFEDSLGKKHRAYLKGGKKDEIILSAGALGSPQLLMLSGVGPRKQLDALKIKVVVEQPFVGQGMADNPLNAVFIPSPIAFKSFGVHMGCFIFKKTNGPLSMGELKVDNLNPTDTPSVTFNYLREPEDLRKCVKGVATILKAIESKAFSNYKFVNMMVQEILDINMRLPRNDLVRSNTSSSLEQYCKDTVRTMWYYHGGCHIGKVVDHEYKHGESLVDNSTSSHVSNANENNESYINDRHENLNEMLNDLKANEGDIDQEDLQKLFEDAEKQAYDGYFGNNFADTSPDSPSQIFTSSEGVINTRARVLGGGTCINAGFYSRGEAQFNKEARLMDENLVQESYKWTERVMVFEPVVQEWPSAVQAALLEAGVTPDNGFTYDHIIGTKVSGTIFDENGTRHTAAYLLQYANPKGLSVLHATVHKILFKTIGKSRPLAYGVVFEDSLRKKHRAYLKGGKKDEIILSAGALGSPQLLMLSGVGPRKQLDALKIKVVVEQPFVGQGMADNPLNAVFIPSPIAFNPSGVQIVGITRFGSYIEAAGGFSFIFTPSPNYRGFSPQMGCFIFKKTNGPLSMGELKDTVRTMWYYHGGCHIGKVVDHEYKVVGINGLRVIDGSTILKSPGTNPQASVLMLGSMIKELSLLNLQVKDVKFAYEDNAVKIEETKKIRVWPARKYNSRQGVPNFNEDFVCNKELGFGRNALFGELRWVLSISFVKLCVSVGQRRMLHSASDGSLNLCLSTLDLLMDTNKKAKFNQQLNMFPSHPKFSDVTEFGKEGRSKTASRNALFGELRWVLSISFVKVTTQKIAALARQRALEKDRQTPFSDATQEVRFYYYGGKLDFVTMVVCCYQSLADIEIVKVVHT